MFYDESGAIGKRYRRQDEVGTPFCITVDGQSIEDGTVTVRDRDTLQQERIAADRVVEYVRERIRVGRTFSGRNLLGRKAKAHPMRTRLRFP